MNSDQKLLQEAYERVLREEADDLSQPVSGQLGTDDQGNFIYIKSLYDPKKFYKSRALYYLFDQDLNEVPHRAPIKEGMLWTEQDVNTIKVYRATDVNGRLMKVEVPREEVARKGLDKLKSEKELQQVADRTYNGNIDLARGMHIFNGPSSFFAKFYSSEQIYKALRALFDAGRLRQREYDNFLNLYSAKLKEREVDSTLSKDFDISPLEDF